MILLDGLALGVLLLVPLIDFCVAEGEDVDVHDLDALRVLEGEAVSEGDTFEPLGDAVLDAVRVPDAVDDTVGRAVVALTLGVML